MRIARKCLWFLVLFVFVCRLNSYASLYTLEDNFEDNKNNWGLDCTELAERKIDDGQYLMMGFMTNWNFWTFAPVPEMVEQVSIEVDIELLEGRGSCGFIFNYHDKGDYYFFLINPAFQCYRVARRDGDKYQTIEDWTHRLDIINKDRNHVKIVQLSSEAKIYINGEYLKTVTVPVHLNGVKNGFVVSTMKQENFLPFYVAFDNFKISGIVWD